QKRELTQLSVARNVLRDKQQRADTLVASLRREGAGLKRALAEKQRQARALDQELDRIIAEEQRRAEEERRRAEAEAAAKAKAEAEKAAKGSTAQATSPEPTPTLTKIPAESSAKKPDVAYNTAASDRALSGSFASNKGRLLFPVAGQYRIVSGFGRTKHPRVPGLEIQNSGIDIEASGHAHARAVFDGEVSSVFRIDGYQNIVILRHGEYLTVYAGLDQIAVRKGDKVKASQRLGHIYSDPDDGGRSVLHFELRHERTKLNPSDWVR
ncbi:MAG: M23 family metallopeptidase, partial [Muribaculaceae bacterium]|nr:M23 family metallopeptidase [Muribaculaceae bacterium]